MKSGLDRTLKLGALSLVLGGLWGCTNLVKTGIGVTNIDDLQENWQQHSTVYLKGTVENQAPFLGSGAYQLQDRTGSIWVVTDETLPSPGENLVIKGQVKHQSIPIAGQELGDVYVQELEQL